MKTIIATVLLVFSASAFAQSVDSPELLKLRESWTKARKAVCDPVDAKYLAALNQMKSSLAKSGKTDEALAIDNEIAAVTGTAPVDIQTPTIGVSPIPNAANRIVVRISAPGGTVLDAAQVIAILDGGATLELPLTDGVYSADYSGGGAKLYIAAPAHEALVKAYPKTGGVMSIALKPSLTKHSVIIHSSGALPGIAGRISPMRDSKERMYLYSTQIGLKDGKKNAEQPLYFALNRPIEAISSTGSPFKIWIVDIESRISLVEYTMPK